jgi:hypothetical protein
MNYSDAERLRAIDWKTATTTLPKKARCDAPYISATRRDDVGALPYCLPPEHAALSLLPEVRDYALVLFAELGIPWHAGINGGPSNHLLSSQVQCVNALGQMVHDPDRLKRAFETLLDIEEVLEVEPGRYLTFEYIGPKDYFTESPRGERTRGAHCTSVDAAFRYRSKGGGVELILVEWKYTESYRLRRPNKRKDAMRARRYGAAVTDSKGPIRAEVLPFELLLDEPLYQLVRQQLLARALEQDPDVLADRVRVVHVSPVANRAYQYSVRRSEHQAIGYTVREIWQRLLRHPDRFIAIDSGRFDDPEITSEEYVARYADEVIRDEDDLNRVFNLNEPRDLENMLYAQYDYDSDVEIHTDGIELRIETDGYPLTYPFTVGELHHLATELSILESEMGH